MKTSTFAVEISAPIQKVWKAISTTEGMNEWAGLKVDTDWQVNRPIVLSCCDEKGEVVEYKGEKMIFNGIIEVKKESREIAFSYPDKLVGIEKESYVLDEIDAGTTSVTFTQTCTLEEEAKDQEQSQRQLMETLKTRLEAN
ncbi:MAG: SRPBCC domain-containing protein [Pyrinomonadaceae bacterium]